MTQTLQNIFVGEFASYFVLKKRGSDKTLNFTVFRVVEDEADFRFERIGRDAGYSSGKTASKLAKYMALINGSKRATIKGREKAELLNLYQGAIANGA